LYTFSVLGCAIWFFNEIRLLVKRKEKHCNETSC